MSSISYAIISKFLQVLQTPTNELTTPITIFLPRDPQTRVITYDAYFTDKSRDGDGVEGLNRNKSSAKSGTDLASFSRLQPFRGNFRVTVISDIT